MGNLDVEVVLGIFDHKLEVTNRHRDIIDAAIRDVFGLSVVLQHDQGRLVLDFLIYFERTHPWRLDKRGLVHVILIVIETWQATVSRRPLLVLFTLQRFINYNKGILLHFLCLFSRQLIYHFYLNSPGLLLFGCLHLIVARDAVVLQEVMYFLLEKASFKVKLLFG